MKKATTKTLLSLALVLTMLGSTLVGCGDQAKETDPKTDTTAQGTDAPGTTEGGEGTTEEVLELEPVTLKWYHPEAEKEGSADVFKVFNEKLAEVLPNTTVEFVSVSDYATNWPILMAGREKIDIAWVGYNTPFYQDVVDGNIMGISDLLAEYAPNIVEEMETYVADWASCTVDGEVYGIPCSQPTVTGVCAIQFSEIVEPYMDLEALMKELDASEKLTEKMLDIIEAAYQGAIDAGVLKLGDPSWKIGPAFPKFGALGYQQIQEGSVIYIDPQADDPEPMYIWEIPEVKMCVERVAEWYEKGWLSETEALGQIPSDAKQMFWHQFDWKSSWALRDERGITETTVQSVRVIDVATNTVEDGYKSPSAFGSASTYLAIPYTSENPERAIMLLNVLHDEVGTVGNELINLLCYGFEKDSAEAKEYGWFNYAASEDADGQPVYNSKTRGQGEDGKTVPSKHYLTNWRVGNTYKIMSDNTALYSVTQKEYCQKFWSELYDGMRETAISGMRFDTSVVSEEMENMTVVFNEYGQRIYYGCGGTDKVDAVMEEALAKLSEAGWDKVKEELKAQIDAYNAAR